jgi:hypothetical protein
MEKIDDILDSLTKSIQQSVEGFLESKDLASKKSQAEIIKLLCESMGVFFNALNNGDAYPFDDYYDDCEDDYDEDDDYEDDDDIVKPPSKPMKLHKGKKDKIPF